MSISPIIKDGKPFLTLNKVAEITGIVIPFCFKNISDEKITDVTQTSYTNLDDAGGVRLFFITQFDEKRRTQYIQYAQRGIIVFSPQELKDGEGKELSYIRLSSHREVRNTFYSIAKHIKRDLKIPTIGITGSIGKTTLTSFMQQIFSEAGRIFVTGGNLNGPGYISREIIRRYDDKFDFHIQEVGGGNPKGVEVSARILDVDAFCISNILPHHLDKYGTIENVLYDKTSFDRISKKEIFGVINIDDDLLRNFNFKNKIITCGIEHSEADYVATNIVQVGPWLELDILNRSISTHIKVNILGKHNAYNVLLAFAMASEWKIPREKIKSGLLKYKSDMIRQSLLTASGRLLYIDCFNVSAESIMTSLKTLSEMPITAGNKKIAVLGGENALGEKSFSVNYEVGLDCYKYDVDEYIIVGKNKKAKAEDVNWFGDGYSLFKGIKRSVKQKSVTYYDNIADAADKIQKCTKSGDIILFKGLYRLCFWGIIDMSFGTSLLNYNQYFIGIPINCNDYSGIYYKEIDGCNITKAKNVQNQVRIPNLIADKPVFRIGKAVFKNRFEVEDLDLGNAVVNIGEEAFCGCEKIREIHIPNSVIHIEKNAFANCISLERVFATSVEHVEVGAFANCKNLTELYLSESCVTIEDGAFEGCPKLTIYAPESSYALNYARTPKLMSVSCNQKNAEW